VRRSRLGGISAIDDELRNHHELGFIGSEIDDTLGDIFRLSYVALWMHGIDGFAAFGDIAVLLEIG
jgi:hypothetical protein